ncbi:hypothetical protein PSm6_20800 [Pseudomonas solani]|uniref:Transmembrane protein n=1 Tax=Pseudomonas solani TaxID=2731552 RepID=A0ABN6BNY8_9PSED|nr:MULTISPECIES: hypothetical protein [Pseudomonas]EQM68801.1 hypothetical protein L682_02200 [Pseudomonas alcaligenes OT 69]MDN4143451.1 hypothetical protein [Pseudomonas tohonis]MDU9411318.1 hypothetical protein [Pseudomonas sp. zfem005]BCD85673.1 hypothetical protein PSm6_20800 [Pseudomonas solani]
MNPALALPDTPPRRTRGRLQLLLILAVVLGPMVLASAMYKLRFWVPEGRSYHGALIGNGQTRADLGVQGAGEPALWQLLVTAPQACEADCQQLVYVARQIHIGLGREAERGSHAFAAAQPLSADYQQTLEREYPRLQRYTLDPAAYGKAVESDVTGPQLWIVDPHGNLVLRYDAKIKGKQILNDLRHLMKLSNIG